MCMVKKACTCVYGVCVFIMCVNIYCVSKKNKYVYVNKSL